MGELSSTFGVHATQIANWKKQALAEFPRIFSTPRTQGDGGENEALVAMLYQQIGQLKVELDWLKKKSDLLG
jgi:putative transposase